MTIIILNFIRQHWLVVAAGLLIAVISLQHFDIKYLDSKISECRSANIFLADSNKRLADSLAIQNEAVLQLQVAGEKKSNAAVKSLAKAQSDYKKYSIKIENLKAQKTTGDECADVVALINNYIK